VKYLFDFGISQDDAEVEIAGLDLREDDRLLCITSAGEVPLNILAEKNITIKAVDISIHQNYLARLKLISSLTFDPREAASFLGFIPAQKKYRRMCLQKVLGMMDDKEQVFWQAHTDAVEQGVISVARFERYMAPFSWMILHLLGKKKILRLMELNTVSEQEKYFDEHIRVRTLRRLFEFIFRPSRYRDRAVPSQGLQNAGEKSRAEFYFSRFRRFCTSTPARKNYYLQYYLFRRILFPEALPGYLTDRGIERIRGNYNKLEFITAHYRDALARNSPHQYNKYHLSNICDWMTSSELESLLKTIDETSVRPFRILSRYLHTVHAIPGSLQNRMAVDVRIEKNLRMNDKFPFYDFVPILSV
jgi:S-adenosylmethionine:diacylglycerol 3-amino-3-carboxypropyl transferase